MKKIRNMKKKEDAVSPVIATILMVAITVVLAAVLYVMVMGMTGTSTTSTSGNWTAMEKTSSTTAKLTFGKFTTDVSWMDVKILISNSTDTYTIEFTDNTPTTSVTHTAGSGATLSAAAVDLASNDQISAGDYITLTFGSTPTGTFNVQVLNVQTGDEISMVGTTSFTM